MLIVTIIGILIVAACVLALIGRIHEGRPFFIEEDEV